MEPKQFIGHLFDTLTGEELAAYTRKQHYSAIQNYPRVEAVARYCAENWPGDLVEIGCLHGSATALFAQVAREHDRRVIAVDPWLELPMYGPNPYGLFRAVVKDYEDIIDIVKLSSLTEEAITYVEARPLCFAYVDGLHTYEAATSDISTVAHCAGIIAVDDIIEYEDMYAGNADIRRAFDEGAKLLHRTPMLHHLCREGYLLPCIQQH